MTKARCSKIDLVLVGQIQKITCVPLRKKCKLPETSIKLAATFRHWVIVYYHQILQESLWVRYFDVDTAGYVGCLLQERRILSVNFANIDRDTLERRSVHQLRRSVESCNTTMQLTAFCAENIQFMSGIYWTGESGDKDRMRIRGLIWPTSSSFKILFVSKFSNEHFHQVDLTFSYHIQLSAIDKAPVIIVETPSGYKT